MSTAAGTTSTHAAAPPAKGLGLRQPSLSFVVGAVVVMIGAYIGAAALGDNSFFTHLATGRYILGERLPEPGRLLVHRTGRALGGAELARVGGLRRARPRRRPRRYQGLLGGSRRDRGRDHVDPHPAGQGAGRPIGHLRCRADPRRHHLGSPSADGRAGAAGRHPARCRATRPRMGAASGLLAVGEQPRLVPPGAGRPRLLRPREPPRRRAAAIGAARPDVGSHRHGPRGDQPARTGAAHVSRRPPEAPGLVERRRRVAEPVVRPDLRAGVPRARAVRHRGARPEAVVAVSGAVRGVPGRRPHRHPKPACGRVGDDPGHRPRRRPGWAGSPASSAPGSPRCSRWS